MPLVHLGKDYHHEVITERKQVYARAALTVPLRLQDGVDSGPTANCCVYADLQYQVNGKLHSFEDLCDDNANSILHEFQDPLSTEFGYNVESLELFPRSKEMDESFVEIVPSSNPDSFSSSFCDSQQDFTVPEPSSLQVEAFTANFPQLFNRGCAGELEEPLSMRRCPPITRLPALLRNVTAQLDLDTDTTLNCDLDPHFSETVVWGKSDLQLELGKPAEDETTSSVKLLVPESPELFSEEYQPYVFPQEKAELLLSPVVCEDPTPCTSQLVKTDETASPVTAAGAVCKEDLTTMSMSSIDPENKDSSGDSDVYDDIKDINKGKEPLVQTEPLDASPAAAESSQPLDFLTLNATEKNSAANRFDTVESPLFNMGLKSPLLFEETYTKDAASLQPLPASCTDSLSPLLSSQTADQMQTDLRKSESCFGGMYSLKFREPLVDKENVANQAVSSHSVKDAMALTGTLDNPCGSSLGVLDLDLHWDITPGKVAQRMVCSPEKFTETTIEKDTSKKTETLSIDFQTIETIVDRDMSSASVESKKNSPDKLDHDKHIDRAAEVHDTEMPNYLQDGMKITGNLSRTLCKDDQNSRCENVKDHVSALDQHADNTFSKNKAATLKSCVETQWSGTSCKELSSGSEKSWPGSREINCQDDENDELLGSWNTGSSSFDREISMLDTVDTVNPISDNIETVVVGSSPETDRHNPQPLHSIDSDFAAFIPDRFVFPKHGKEKSQITSKPLSETEPSFGFDLQFDDDELLLGSDSFEDVSPGTANIPEPMNRPNQDKSQGAGNQYLCASPVLDPVDAFLMLRDARISTKERSQAVKGHSIVKATPKPGSGQFSGVITPMSVIPRGVDDAKCCEQRVATVALSGMFLKALEEMVNHAETHLHRLKAKGIVNTESTLLNLKPDYTRFLLKDRMNKLASAGRDKSEDEVYQSLVLVHTLRTAASLLEHCCLESAIVHLANMQDTYPDLKGPLEGLRKAVFQHQFRIQESGQLHPKVAALCREIQQHKSLRCGPHRVVVVVRREQPTLVRTLQAAISMDGISVTDCQGKTLNKWPEDSEVVLTWDHAIMDTLLPQATLVVEFETDGKDKSSVYSSCKDRNVNFVGLCAASTNRENGTGCTLKKTSDIVQAEVSNATEGGIVVLGSQKLVRHQQLLQLLETRHNIVVYRRDYASAGLQHYPDVVVGVDRGAVLLHVKQLKEEGGLQRLMEEMAALGIQLNTVWLLLHCLRENARAMFGVEVLKKTVQLQAVLANLSTAAKGTSFSYKVLLCQTAGDVAQYIHKLATCKTHVAPPDTGQFAIHLTPDMLKEEQFLLGIPCLNSYSCQLLLSRATIGEVMIMTRDQLHRLYPELSPSIIENLYLVINLDRGLQLRPQRVDLQTFTSSDTFSHYGENSVDLDLQSEAEYQDVPLMRKHQLPAVVDSCRQTQRPFDTSVGLYDQESTSFCQDVNSSMLGQSYVSSKPFTNARFDEYDSVSPHQSNSVSSFQHAEKRASIKPAGVSPPLLAKRSRQHDDQYKNSKFSKDGSGFKGSASGFWTGERLGDQYSDISRFDLPQTTNAGARQAAVTSFAGSLGSTSQPTPLLEPIWQQHPSASFNMNTSRLGHSDGISQFNVNLPGRSAERKRAERWLQDSTHLQDNQFVQQIHQGEFNANTFGRDYRHLSSYGIPQEPIAAARSCDPLPDPEVSRYGGNSIQHAKVLGETNSNDLWYDLPSPMSSCSGRTGLSLQYPDFMLNKMRNERPSDSLGYSSLLGGQSVPQESLLFKPDNSLSQSTNFRSSTGDISRARSLACSASPCGYETSVYNKQNVRVINDPQNFSSATSTSQFQDNLCWSKAGSFGTSVSSRQPVYERSEPCSTSVDPGIRSSGVSGFPSYNTEYSANGQSGVAEKQLQLLYGPRSSFGMDLAATTRRLLQGHRVSDTDLTQSYKSPESLHHIHHRKPRTPVGLAQPLRRENPVPQDERVVCATAAVSPKMAAKCSDLMSSPPLDMDWDLTENTASSSKHLQGISTAKFRKLSAQFYQPNQTSADQDMFSQEKENMGHHNKKLTYIPVSGAMGQTKLTFM